MREDDGELSENWKMKYVPDYHFSTAELNWIEKHFQPYDSFIICYGLKPWVDEDCEDARSIVRAMMDDC